MPTGRAEILHADLDSFFASVEQRDDPALRGRPVAVGGGGVVLAASYEAKAHGVRTAMSGWEARSLCPGLVLVPPRMDAYAEASRAVFDVFHDTSPVVEGLSIDEAFLDVSGLRRLVGPPVDVARGLRAAVRERVGLPITVGVARTKFLAKVASAAAKPDGLLVVEPDGEVDFLHPLPVERLWGVGPKTAARLHAYGVRLVADVAGLPLPTLVSILGGHWGRHLHALAHNRDTRPVQGGRRRTSVGAQRAFGRRRLDPAALDADLVALVDRVTARLRAAHRVGRTVSVRTRFEDHGRMSRSHTLPWPTAHTPTVLAAARHLLEISMPELRRRGVTLVGLAVGHLSDDGAVQLALPFGAGADHALDLAVDEVRTRFGSGSITRAVQVGRPQGVAMPLLPD